MPNPIMTLILTLTPWPMHQPTVNSKQTFLMQPRANPKLQAFPVQSKANLKQMYFLNLTSDFETFWMNLLLQIIGNSRSPWNLNHCMWHSPWFIDFSHFQLRRCSMCEQLSIRLELYILTLQITTNEFRCYSGI